MQGLCCFCRSSAGDSPTPPELRTPKVWGHDVWRGHPDGWRQTRRKKRQSEEGSRAESAVPTAHSPGEAGSHLRCAEAPGHQEALIRWDGTWLRTLRPLVQNPRDWASYAAGVCFLTVQEAGSSRLRWGQGWFLVRPSPLFAGGGAFSPCFHAICPLFTRTPGVSCVLISSSYEVTSQIRLGPHFHLITLLKALSLNTITFRDTGHWIWWGGGWLWGLGGVGCNLADKNILALSLSSWRISCQQVHMIRSWWDSSLGGCFLLGVYT